MQVVGIEVYEQEWAMENSRIVTGITELWWNSLCDYYSSMGDRRSFRKDRLASPGFAVNKIGRTCREVAINGSIVCNSSEIVVTEIWSFTGPGLQDST